MDSGTNRLVAKGLVAVAALAVLAAVAAGFIAGRARAAPAPAAAALAVAQSAAAVTSGPAAQAESFNVTCDTTAAGVVIAPATEPGMAWSMLYCENLSATSVFWGGLDSDQANFTNANHHCISTTSSTCAKPYFSIDARRGVMRCKSGGSVTITCTAAGP